MRSNQPLWMIPFLWQMTRFLALSQFWEHRIELEFWLSLQLVPCYATCQTCWSVPYTVARTVTHTYTSRPFASSKIKQTNIFDCTKSGWACDSFNFDTLLFLWKHTSERSIPFFFFEGREGRSNLKHDFILPFSCMRVIERVHVCACVCVCVWIIVIGIFVASTKNTGRPEQVPNTTTPRTQGICSSG